MDIVINILIAIFLLSGIGLYVFLSEWLPIDREDSFLARYVVALFIIFCFPLYPICEGVFYLTVKAGAIMRKIAKALRDKND